MGWQRTTSGALEDFLKAPVRLLGLLLPLTFLLLGCGASTLKDGPQRRDIVDTVQIQGIPDETIHKQIVDGIGTRPSSSFLWRHTYETYDAITLERDLLRIERELRRRGYYEAKVRAARIIRLDEIEKKRVVLSPVRVEIEVDPGPPIIIGKLETRGLAALPFAVARAAAQENRLREGQLLDENELEGAKVDIANSLADRGYAFAGVSATARVDLAQRSAHVVMEAKPGPTSKLGRVSIEGLEKLNEKAVRRILDLQEGTVYSRKQIRLARSALFQLGMFSKVEIVPDLSHPEGAVVPLTVRLEESSLHELNLGAGGRLDLLRLAVVGHITWTHMNFLGGLRRLTIATHPGLTFYPTHFPSTITEGFQAPSNIFPENFFSVRIEQPGFLEARTKGFHEGGYNIYPLLYVQDSKTDTKEDLVVGYNELTTAVGLSRSFFKNALETTLSLHWQGNFPFTYETPESGAENPNSLIDVQVIYPELYTRFQFLDDPIQPTRGVAFSNSIQVATGLFNTLSDVRIRPEIRTFVPLDKRHKVVLASRFGVGMVLAANYGSALDPTDPSLSPDQQETVIEDQQKMIFRAFYSGGPGSNRGYPYREVGPQGPIAFLLPNDVDCVADPNNSTCLRPLGGFTMWEASTELRFRFAKSWSAVVFVDASDVSSQKLVFNFKQPHLSVGPGIRYHSPFGPVRLDWGFRVPGMQSLKSAPNEPRDVSHVPPYDEDGASPYDDVKWFKRFAVNILIGEDF